MRYFCKDCGGNGICEHGNRKGRCKICKGLATAAGVATGASGAAAAAGVDDFDPFWDHHDMDYDHGGDDMLPGLSGLGGEQREAVVVPALDPRFVVQDGFIEENPFADSNDDTEDHEFSGGKRKRRYTKRRRQNNKKTKKNKKMKKRKKF